MSLQTLASFELTAEVTRKFLDMNNIPLPDGEFPFKQFLVSFPMEALMVENFERPNVDPKLYNDFLKEHLNVMFTFEDDGLLVSVSHRGKLAASVKLSPSPEVIESDYNEEYTIALARSVMIIGQGVIWHYLSPVTVKHVDEVRESKSKSNIVGYKSPSKKYIYRTKYVFQNADRDISKEARVFTRRTDSWMVQGHTRKYRDAEGNVIKEVQVKPYIKGKGEPKEIEYKITRA